MAQDRDLGQDRQRHTQRKKQGKIQFKSIGRARDRFRQRKRETETQRQGPRGTEAEAD